MAEQTKIQWCDHTFSPWHGCQKVSPGCTNCYAERQSKRNPAVLGVWGPDGTRVIASEHKWALPRRWDRAAHAAVVRRRVFCGSICDVFEDRPELVQPRVRLYHLIQETPALDWLLLTKRPENVRRFQGATPGSWAEMPRNVWLGTSVEDQQRAAERIPVLLSTPARVRFLSVEPLLGPVDLRGFFHLASRHPDDRLHWVILGGESGPHARPCDVAWIRSLVDQCEAAQVACFVKQLGACPVATPVPGYTTGLPQLEDRKGGDPEEWPPDLRVRQFPAP